MKNKDSNIVEEAGKTMGICLIIGLLLQGYFNIRIQREYVFGLLFFFFVAILEIGFTDGIKDVSIYNGEKLPHEIEIDKLFEVLASSIPYIVSTFYLLIVLGTLYSDWEKIKCEEE